MPLYFCPMSDNNVFSTEFMHVSMSLHVKPATEVEICANLWLTLFDLLLCFSAVKANIWLLHTGTTGYSTNPFNNFFCMLRLFFWKERWFSFCEYVLFERSKWSMNGLFCHFLLFFVYVLNSPSFQNNEKGLFHVPFLFFPQSPYSSLTDAVLTKLRGVFSTKSKMVDDERDSPGDIRWNQPNRKRQRSDASFLPSVVFFFVVGSKNP